MQLSARKQTSTEVSASGIKSLTTAGIQTNAASAIMNNPVKIITSATTFLAYLSARCAIKKQSIPLNTNHIPLISFFLQAYPEQCLGKVLIVLVCFSVSTVQSKNLYTPGNRIYMALAARLLFSSGIFLNFARKLCTGLMQGQGYPSRIKTTRLSSTSIIVTRTPRSS